MYQNDAGVYKINARHERKGKPVTIGSKMERKRGGADAKRGTCE